MTSSPANASPLRQRMIDDMRMRQLSPKTQATYLRIVREFARFLGRSPDTPSRTCEATSCIWSITAHLPYH
jgi:hypothetical protein